MHIVAAAAPAAAALATGLATTGGGGGRGDQLDRFRGPRVRATSTVCEGGSLGLDVGDCDAWAALYDALDGTSVGTA